MRFAAVRACSFVDWPGRLAAAAFTQGCNLACRYCQNPSLLQGAPAAPVEGEAVLAHLRARRGRLDGVVVTGGEPTLHPDLPVFLAAAKSEGFLVKLDTNGTRPEVVEVLLAAGLVDHLAVDVKALPDVAAWLTGDPDQPRLARRCLDLAIAAGVDHEARTTVAAPVHDAAHLAALGRWLTGIRRWALQSFRPGGHLDPHAGLVAPAPALLERAAREAAGRGTEVVVR